MTVSIFELAIAMTGFTIFGILLCVLTVTNHKNDVYIRQSKKYASLSR